MSLAILLVEDDADLARGLRFNLEHEGHQVRCATRLAEARQALSETAFDLVLLDLSLPDGDGLDLLRSLRVDGQGQPVICLTARGAESDIVMGLRLGADDYLTKPFGLAQLLARIDAVLRRAAKSDAMRESTPGPTQGSAPTKAEGAGVSRRDPRDGPTQGSGVSRRDPRDGPTQGAGVSRRDPRDGPTQGAGVSRRDPRDGPTQGSGSARGDPRDGPTRGSAPTDTRGGHGAVERSAAVLRLGAASIDFEARVVRRDGGSTELTPIEIEILRYLEARRGSAVERKDLLRDLWGLDRLTTRTLDNHVARLRKKIEDDPTLPRWIVTAHGVGYRLERA